MYIHLGQTIVVREKEIIGLFDLDHITYNGRAAAFVNNAERTGRLIIETYLSPNRTFVDLPEFIDEMDPLHAFGEACRCELLNLPPR